MNAIRRWLYRLETCRLTARRHLRLRPVWIILLALTFIAPAPLCFWYIMKTGQLPPHWAVIAMTFWIVYGKMLFSAKGYT